MPLQEGLIGEDHIRGSLGELLLGKAEGRVSKDDITIFDALGLAVEDVASAKMVPWVGTIHAGSMAQWRTVCIHQVTALR